MDYTQNHHLPQWIKSDRIMMDDFNAAFASIDKGLSERNQAVDNLSGQISNVSNTLSQQITDRALEGATFDRFCRAAYNHYHLAKLSDPFPRQMGAFHQSFTPEDVTVPGMTRRGDCCYMGVGTRAVSLKAFYDSLIVDSQLNVAYNAAVSPLIIRFSATMPGILKTLRLNGRSDANHPHVQNGPCHVTFVNLTTGATDASFDITLGISGNTTQTGTRSVELNIPFHSGYSYRLTVEPTNKYYNYNSLMVYDSGFQAELLNFPSVNITRQINGIDPCSGGIVLAHFNSYIAGGTVSLLWNNQNIPPYKTRTITDEDGRSLKEIEFRKNGAVPASNTIQLQLRCNTNGEMALYRWGGVMI